LTYEFYNLLRKRK